MCKYRFFIIMLFLITITEFTLSSNSYGSEAVFSKYLVETSSSNLNIPIINAKHAVVLDRASKTKLFSKQENDQCKMASTTKIMTAIIVIENCLNLNEQITISKKAARNGWF